MNTTAPIERDLSRFHRIVRGAVRKNMRKYIVDDALIGRKGKDLVRIPVPEIDLPTFRFGRHGGVGQGKGGIGDPIGRGDEGEGGAGTGEGDHIIEVELTIEELAEILGEELELPRIQPKQRREVMGEIYRFTSARRTGPESLRYMKRTYFQSLRRMILEGLYDPDDPVIIPIKDDKRYRSWRTFPCPESNAVVVYMMDYSGSMDDRRKRLVRLTAFWIDAWIQFHYTNVITRYIIHDTKAYLVDQEDFYRLSSGGGTYISSAYRLCADLIDREFSPDDWNLYAFDFSDGENWDNDDQRALDTLFKDVLPKVNLFCYGQVQLPGLWFMPDGGFYDKIAQIDAENLILAKLEGEEGVYEAIKTFLGKGY